MEAISNGGQILLSTEVEYNYTLKITIADTGDSSQKNGLRKLDIHFIPQKKKVQV